VTSLRTYTRSGTLTEREDEAPYKLLLPPGNYGGVSGRITDHEGEVVRSEIPGLLSGYWGKDYDHVYGSLDCKSGTRMKPENRVFFRSEDDAIKLGFRPCLNCNNSKVVSGYLERKKELGLEYTEWDSRRLKNDAIGRRR
jgi:hypothetical protein